MKNCLPFRPSAQVAASVQKSVTSQLLKRQRERMAQVLSPQNVLRYSHGTTWKHPGNPDSEDGGMETHKAEFAIPNSRIMDGDLTLIDESLETISGEFHRQLMQSMYGLMSRTCDRTGNTVDGANLDFPEAFAQMLEKVEFGVDRNGEVSIPQFHTSSDKFLSILQSQPREYEERIDEIVKRKKMLALEKEAERKSRFKDDA